MLHSLGLGSNENKEKYQFGNYLLIQYQIHLIDIRIVWQTVRRINKEILGAPRLIGIRVLKF